MTITTHARRPVSVRALLAAGAWSLCAMVLTACGGGSDGVAPPPATTPPPNTPPPTVPPTRNEAARFLTQATFAPASADVDRVAALGYSAWLDEQFNAQASTHLPAVPAFGDTITPQFVGQFPLLSSFWTKAAIAPDQLRQRAMYSLSQMFVISMNDNNVMSYPQGIATYMDHAFLSGSHPPLLAQLAAALSAFDAALGELNVRNQVTTFTASDFGRSLASNGDGSDHGWGAHHFVVGGAVKGRDIYGQFPVVALGANDDAGQGRFIPTTSVDQYAASFARWMGRSDAQLADVLPNLQYFSPAALPLFV